jgi:hypothetical protein
MRIRYPTTAAYAVDCYRSCGAGAPSPVWDLDAAGNAVVPGWVKRAHLLQACSLAKGGRSKRLQAIADGLVSQSAGGVSESYRADAAPSPLCVDAARIMNQYRLKQGEYL